MVSVFVLAALAGLLMCPAARPQPVQLTAGSVALTFRAETAAVETLEAGGFRAEGDGGFFVRDFAAGTPDEPLRGSLTLAPEGLVGRLLAEAAQIELAASVTPRKDHLAVSATVRDLTGRDRAVVVSFRLPVNARPGEWWWDDDLRASRPIADVGRDPALLVVSGNNPAGVDTPALEAGKTYTLTASGYVSVAGSYGESSGWWADAEWADYYGGQGYPDGPRIYHEEHPFGDPTCWELLVDGKPVDWLGSEDSQQWAPHVYSPDHTYRLTLTGTGAPINLRRLDHMRDDRSGTLTVRVHPVPPGPAPGLRYETTELFSWGGTYSLGRYIARYPFCCLRSNQTALSLAVPLTEPRIYRLAYVQTAPDRGYLEVSFELGLSPDLKRSPSAARVDFELAAADPRWGLRSVARQYYDRHPECFRTEATRHGCWVLRLDPGAIPEPWDFGMMFDETATVTPRQLQWDADFDIYAFHYIEAGGVWTGFWGYDDTPTNTAYPQEAGVAPDRLTAEFLSRRDQNPAHYDALSAAALYDKQGSWVWLRWTNEYPGTGPRASHQTAMMNPDIPGGYGRRYLDGTLAELDRYARQGLRVDGVYQDSISMYIAMFPENYRREHWAYTDLPLTFSHDTRAPVQLHADGMWEFSRELSRALRQRGRLMMANTYPPADQFFFPFLDMFGTETSGGSMNPPPYMRLYAYHKPISFLDYYLIGSHFHAPPDWFSLERAMHNCLFWGVFPGSSDFTATNRAPVEVEAARPLYRRFIPLITEVSEAGWEPVTHASSPQPGLWVSYVLLVV